MNSLLQIYDSEGNEFGLYLYDRDTISTEEAQDIAELLMDKHDLFSPDVNTEAVEYFDDEMEEQGLSQIYIDAEVNA